MSEDCEFTCHLCDIKVEHHLELVEHRATLSHQIKLQATRPVGDTTHHCTVCHLTCADLPAYSKHVDSDKHCTKLRKLRTKRIAVMDACIPMKRNARWNESPAYLPPPLYDPSRPPLSFHPNIHTGRTPLLAEQYSWHEMAQPPFQQQPGPSNRAIYAKDNRKNMYAKDNRKTVKKEKSQESPSGEKGNGKMKKKEEGKKKTGVISKVLSAAAIVKKQKTVEIVTTPKVTSMGNKNKKYESLALKGMGMVTTNKSRTQVMMMERQTKYSLVDGQGGALEDCREGSLTSPVPSFPSFPSIGAPPYGFSPPLPLPPSSSRDISFALSSSSDATYAYCHQMHSTPHQLHDSNWPQFVRGLEDLQVDTPSSSAIPPPQAQDSFFLNRRVKEEVMEVEDVKPEATNQTLPMDSLNQQIIEKQSRLNRECEEQEKKVIAICSRRDEMRRRFEMEMKKIEEEEEGERKKLKMMESNRTAFQSNIEKAKNDMKEAQRNMQKVLQLPF